MNDLALKVRKTKRRIITLIRARGSFPATLVLRYITTGWNANKLVTFCSKLLRLRTDFAFTACTEEDMHDDTYITLHYCRALLRNEQPLVDPDISWIFLGKRYDTNMSTEQKYIAGEFYNKPQKTTWEDHVHYGVIDRHRMVIFTRFIKVAPGKVSI